MALSYQLMDVWDEYAECLPGQAPMGARAID
jgi:hypothetical protein